MKKSPVKLTVKRKLLKILDFRLGWRNSIHFCAIFFPIVIIWNYLYDDSLLHRMLAPVQMRI